MPPSQRTLDLATSLPYIPRPPKTPTLYPPGQRTLYLPTHSHVPTPTRPPYTSPIDLPYTPRPAYPTLPKTPTLHLGAPQAAHPIPPQLAYPIPSLHVPYRLTQHLPRRLPYTHHIPDLPAGLPTPKQPTLHPKLPTLCLPTGLPYTFLLLTYPIPQLTYLPLPRPATLLYCPKPPTLHLPSRVPWTPPNPSTPYLPSRVPQTSQPTYPTPPESGTLDPPHPSSLQDLSGLVSRPNRPTLHRPPARGSRASTSNTTTSRLSSPAVSPP
jgi:hypothetical protein